MVLTTTEPTEDLEEQRVLLRDIPWSVYTALRDADESSAVRMTYLEGFLEIMSPSKRHEDRKAMMGRLLSLFALERDIDVYAHGSVTLRRKLKKRGLEPDECYCRGDDKTVPDLALEVIVSAPLLDKLEVYRGLGVREVWVPKDGVIDVYVLARGKYERRSTSVVFPEVELSVLAQFAERRDQPAALREFRDRVRGH